jgi:hypothetical protein
MVKGRTSAASSKAEMINMALIRELRDVLNFTCDLYMRLCENTSNHGVLNAVLTLEYLDGFV